MFCEPLVVFDLYLLYCFLWYSKMIFSHHIDIGWSNHAKTLSTFVLIILSLPFLINIICITTFVDTTNWYQGFGLRLVEELTRIEYTKWLNF